MTFPDDQERDDEESAEPALPEITCSGGITLAQIGAVTYMASNPLFYDNSVIASVNAVTVLCNSGFLNIYTGSQPALDGSITGTLLVSLPMSSTAFATATALGGTVTANANAITPTPAAASGTAAYFALLKSDAATVVATGAAGTSGSDLNLSTTAITAGQTVACSSFQITQAQT